MPSPSSALLRLLAAGAVPVVAASSGVELLLAACNTTSPAQRFARTPLPANIAHPPLHASQIVLNGTGIPECPTDGPTRCCVNVAAWGTKPGDRVWVTECTAEEPVDHELNRVWVHDDATGTDGDLLRNPTSKLCADAAGGTHAAANAPLELVDCEGANASRWVFSAVDGSLAQATHSGGYPGLCMQYSPPGPSPAPAPPGPPETVAASVVLPASARSNATTSSGMASFNLDWHEDGEEAPVWVNMSAMKLDLTNPLLVAAAKALGPGAVLRIGGSEGDVVCYDVPEYGSTCADMNQTDPAMCLNMSRFEALCDFATATGARLVFGLNAVWGRGNHSLDNPLDFTNIEALMKYAAAHKLPIHGFELGNEKCGPPPEVFAADYWKFRGLVDTLWPDAADVTRPLVIGNDCNTNPGYLREWLPLLNDSVLDVLTYHRYTGNGLDPHLQGELMQPAHLDSTLSLDIQDVHAHLAPSAELWVGEGAASWHSGRPGVTNAFASSFWWLDALGVLAANNHTHYCRQTLIGGSYGLLNRTTFAPNPDYYSALLFHRLMGDVVLGPKAVSGHPLLERARRLGGGGAAATPGLGLAGHADPVADGWLRVYAHCARATNDGQDAAGSGASKGAVTMLFINLSPTDVFEVAPAAGTPALLPRTEYVLTADGLASRSMRLNGVVLTPTSHGAMPAMPGAVGHNATFTLQPRSMAFLVLPSFGAHACE